MDGSSYKLMFGGYDKAESKTTDTAPGEAIVSLGFSVVWGLGFWGFRVWSDS